MREGPRGQTEWDEGPWDQEVHATLTVETSWVEAKFSCCEDSIHKHGEEGMKLKDDNDREYTEEELVHEDTTSV